ncbi:MAG: hypothetical protein ACP5T0_06440 [Verrucomicrobiia bacterium]
MDWQEITALTIVALAAILLAVKFIKKRKRGFVPECCEVSSARRGSITYSVKKGERPKIVMKL